MRISDAHTIATSVSGKELMMRAGRAVFENVEWKPPVAVVCGTGNNAGDGYVIARLLHDAKIDCTLILLEEKFSEDGKYYFDICEKSGIEVRLWNLSGIVSGSDEPLGTESVVHFKDEKKPVETGLVAHLEDRTEPSESSPAVLYKEGTDLHKYSTIVDCIFGTGYKGSIHTSGGGGLAGKAAEVIDAINSSGAYVVSVDINSGLNGDSGMCGENNGEPACVVSDLTVSIGSFKPGHFLSMAKDVIKRKINCDIGIKPVEKPFYLLEKADIEPYFRPRKNYSNKGTYGYTALIGGSKRYSGAIRLAAMAEEATSCTKGDATDNNDSAKAAASCTKGDATDNNDFAEPADIAGAAMRSGAGVVKVAVADSLCAVVAPAVLESTLFPLSDDGGNIRFVESEIAELISNVKTAAFGMGIGVTEETAKILEYLLDNYTGRLIIDADGLTLLSKMSTERIRNSKPELILTPHIREFSRLLEGWCNDLLKTGTTSKDIISKDVIGDPEREGIGSAISEIGDISDISNISNISNISDIGNILSTPIEYAQQYARAHNVVLLLKGPSTIITNGDITYITDAGCAGMATAGSGDVLSGILSAVCAYLPDAIQKADSAGSANENDPGSSLTLAVAAGAYINGKAGELAQSRLNSISMVAGDTVSCIADVITGLQRKV